MFIAKNNDLIISAKNTIEELEQTLKRMAYTSIEETDTVYIYHNGSYFTQDELAQLEHERIQKLSVTKSDFFDATIKAFGLDDTDLLPIVTDIIAQVEVPEVMKKIALNNFKNAKDFYRNHEIFNVLAGKPILIDEQLIITITSEQFDRYFDKASQHDPEAYKELLPIINTEV